MDRPQRQNRKKARLYTRMKIISNLDGAVNRGHKQRDLIIMDFAMAFDKVPHRRLLHNLEYYGIKDPHTSRSKIVSEYDQEISHSQTADKPMAPRGRATQQSGDIMKTY